MMFSIEGKDSKTHFNCKGCGKKLSMDWKRMPENPMPNYCMDCQNKLKAIGDVIDDLYEHKISKERAKGKLLDEMI